eukprot:83248-Amphidinium_carterae.1
MHLATWYGARPEMQRSIAFYTGLRCLHWDRMDTPVFRVHGGVLAGDSMAMNLMMLITSELCRQ